MVIDLRQYAQNMKMFLKEALGIKIYGKTIGIFTSSDPGAKMYLKYIKKDAEYFNVNIVELNENSEAVSADGFLFQYPIDYDIPEWAKHIQHSDKDLDTMNEIENDRLPLASAAVLEALDECYGLVECANVVMIGRGNAVKGLDVVLDKYRAHVIVCHSKTPCDETISSITNADIIIHAAPNFNIKDVQIPDNCMVFDLTGNLKKSDAENSNYKLVTNIGSLTRFYLFLNLEQRCSGRTLK